MKGDRLPSFLMGVGLGAAIGLLLVPKRGGDVREDLRPSAGEDSDFDAGPPSELRETGGDADEAQRARLAAALDTGVEAYRDAVGEHW